MIMISVLRSGDSRDIFSFFEDFDEYLYDNYTEASLFSGSFDIFETGGLISTASPPAIEVSNISVIQEWRKKVKYEVLGGYIMVLRGFTGDIYSGIKVDKPDFYGIKSDAGCHLIGKTKANLYPGNTGVGKRIILSAMKKSSSTGFMVLLVVIISTIRVNILAVRPGILTRV